MPCGRFGGACAPFAPPWVRHCPIYILFVDPTVCLSVSSDFPVAASRGIIFAKTEYLEM